MTNEFPKFGVFNLLIRVEMSQIPPLEAVHRVADGVRLSIDLLDHGGRGEGGRHF